MAARAQHPCSVSSCRTAAHRSTPPRPGPTGQRRQGRAGHSSPARGSAAWRGLRAVGTVGQQRVSTVGRDVQRGAHAKVAPRRCRGFADRQAASATTTTKLGWPAFCLWSTHPSTQPCRSPSAAPQRGSRPTRPGRPARTKQRQQQWRASRRKEAAKGWESESVRPCRSGGARLRMRVAPGGLGVLSGSRHALRPRSRHRGPPPRRPHVGCGRLTDDGYYGVDRAISLPWGFIAVEKKKTPQIKDGRRPKGTELENAKRSTEPDRDGCKVRSGTHLAGSALGKKTRA